MLESTIGMSLKKVCYWKNRWNIRYDKAVGIPQLFLYSYACIVGKYIVILLEITFLIYLIVLEIESE